MVDDRSSTVSLPEVPLLGVLPGTGGLTRLIDKRKMRRDLADVFCTTAEGVRADRARDWRLVDHIAKPAEFTKLAQARAEALAAASDRPANAKGIALTPLAAHGDETGYRLLARRRGASMPISAHRDAHGEGARPRRPSPTSTRSRPPAPSGGRCAIARELDDAILMLRTNQPEIGLWMIRRRAATPMPCSPPTARCCATPAIGSCAKPPACCAARCARLDVSSRWLFAIVDRGLLLRRPVLRDRAGRRPHLHARRHGGQRRCPRHRPR